MRNQSVPTNSMLLHLVYEDVEEASSWLARVFGFTEHYRYGAPEGPVSGAQMYLEHAWVMLRRAQPGAAKPSADPNRKPSVTVIVNDAAAHYAQAKAADAVITEELNETFYGERQYAAEDLAGHRWLFAQHLRDVKPEEWGATVVHSPF